MRRLRNSWVELSVVVVLVLALFAAYLHQRSAFIHRANATFDPNKKALQGTFLPWPIGRPTLFGHLDPSTDSRIRASLQYEHGLLNSNGVALRIFASDGHFTVMPAAASR